MTLLDVIIPTKNRLNALRPCLDSIKEQNLEPNKFCVVLVDDGSSQSNFKKLLNLQLHYKFFIKVLQNQGRGPAVGRNLALDNTKSNLILFLNDDVVLVPQHFQTHLDYHRRYPAEEVCVRGMSLWHPELPDSSVMRHKRRTHQRYDVEIEEDIRELAFFHTMDLSVKRPLIMANKFDEDFPYASFEDTELGWRLKKKGKLKLLIAKEARSFHFHRVTARALIKRAKINGFSAAMVLKKHPDLHQLLLGRFLQRRQRQRVRDIIKNLLTLKVDDIWQDVEDFFYLRALLKNLK